MPEMNEQEHKRIVKEAIKEWMDEKYTHLGKWSSRMILVAALGALIMFILNANGWHHK